MRSFSRDEDKHKAVNKGCTAIRRGKLMAKTYGIVLVPVLGVAMPGSTPVTVRRRLYVIDYKLQIFRASRLLDGLNNIGGDDL